MQRVLIFVDALGAAVVSSIVVLAVWHIDVGPLAPFAACVFFSVLVASQLRRAKNKMPVPLPSRREIARELPIRVLVVGGRIVLLAGIFAAFSAVELSPRSYVAFATALLSFAVTLRVVRLFLSNHQLTISFAVLELVCVGLLVLSLPEPNVLLFGYIGVALLHAVEAIPVAQFLSGHHVGSPLPARGAAV